MWPNFRELRRLGRSITFILLCEAFGTFVLVSLSIYALTNSWYTALIFGALASATAPAATVDVLAEYDAAGPFTTTEQAGPVVYVLFFALVGARFQLAYLPTMGLIGLAYIFLRSFGKFTGTWLGGWLGNAQPVVRDNLGFGLLSQAGVAMGLAIASADRFSQFGPQGKALADLIINVICATTFVVQIIGTVFVKFAIQRAGEIGKAKLGPEVWASEGAPE